MHWEPDFFWQEEEEEKRWCMQCTQCDELNFSEFPISDFNCDDNDDPNRTCQLGDQLWLRNCDDGYGVEFSARYNGILGGVQLPIADELLCVTRTRQRYVTLQLCDSLDPTQLWKPEVSAQQEFRLVPLVFHPNDMGQEFCMTQVCLLACLLAVLVASGSI